jgi:multicomponent Na+:H+ antiporter subunit E
VRTALTKALLNTFVILAAVWLLWSGHLEPLLLASGAISCLFVTLVAGRMRLLGRTPHAWIIALRALAYAPWLLKEILKSAFDVARRILDPRLPVSPTLIRVKASQKTEFGTVLYANSITLTPGTVSVDVTGDEIQVHALTREGAEALLEGEMDRRAAWVDGTR